MVLTLLVIWIIKFSYNIRAPGDSRYVNRTAKLTHELNTYNTK